jgi:molybdopterin-binding protein
LDRREPAYPFSNRPASGICGILLSVPTYGMSQAAELLGVSPDTVRRWADAGRLATRRTAGGHRRVDGAALADFAVSLAVERHPPAIVSASARNRLSGLVTRVVRDTVMAQVEIQAGPFRVVSLMSREAADDLGLAPGVMAVAAVKATNVVVELPAQRNAEADGPHTGH